jgi:hypothetical protein
MFNLNADYLSCTDVSRVPDLRWFRDSASIVNVMSDGIASLCPGPIRATCDLPSRARSFTPPAEDAGGIKRGPRLRDPAVMVGTARERHLCESNPGRGRAVRIGTFAMCGRLAGRAGRNPARIPGGSASIGTNMQYNDLMPSATRDDVR